MASIPVAAVKPDGLDPSTQRFIAHTLRDFRRFGVDKDEATRTRIQQIGLEGRDVAQNLLVSLSSSFQTSPTFWLNPINGVVYQVAVQSPQ